MALGLGIQEHDVEMLREVETGTLKDPLNPLLEDSGFPGLKVGLSQLLE